MMKSHIKVFFKLYGLIAAMLLLLIIICLPLTAQHTYSKTPITKLNILITQKQRALVSLNTGVLSSISMEENTLIKSVSESIKCPLVESKNITNIDKDKKILKNVHSNNYKGYWYIYGICQNFLSQQGSLLTAEINPAPLVQLLKPLNIKEINVEIRHPFKNLPTLNATQKNNFSNTQVYKIPVGETSSSPIYLEFGYRPIHIFWMFLPLFTVLIIPIILILGMRQVALAAFKKQQIDVTAIWFNYFRFLNWFQISIWLVWFAAIYLSNFRQFIEFILWDKPRWQSLSVELSLSFFTPAILIILCFGISHPVFTKVRGIQWSLTDLIYQTFLSQSVSIFPLMFIIVGFNNLMDDSRLSAGLFASAYISYILFSRLSTKAKDFTPHAVTVGEMRDRIFNLAAKAGVKLKQIYVLPTGKGQLANAFASAGNNILISEYLLQQMNKREVDAIIAHELGHLKHKHPQALSQILVFTVLGVSIGSGIIQIFWNWQFLPIVSGAMILPIYYIFSRRFEYTADREAVALSEDAPACITALKKLTRFNLQPMQWGKLDEKMVTHPSTWHRVEAIAKTGGISGAELEQILNTEADDSDYYDLPTNHVNTTKIFSTTFKSNTIFIVYWVQNIIKILTPAIFFYLAQFYHSPGIQWIIYLIGIIITIDLYEISNHIFAVWGYEQLQQKLKVKFQKQGIKVNKWHGIFVSFAPADSPQIYEGFWEWDIGFLFMSGGYLYYIGEQSSFALKQQHITNIYLDKSYPNWWGYKKVYISWYDQEKGSAGTFNISPAALSSLWQLTPAIKKLNKNLQNWWQQPSDSSNLPLDLETPNIGTITSISAQEIGNVKYIMPNLYILSFMAIFISLICQFPFISIIYIILAACLTTIWKFIPFWQQR